MLRTTSLQEKSRRVSLEFQAASAQVRKQGKSGRRIAVQLVDLNL